MMADDEPHQGNSLFAGRRASSSSDSTLFAILVKKSGVRSNGLCHFLRRRCMHLIDSTSGFRYRQCIAPSCDLHSNTHKHGKVDDHNVDISFGCGLICSIKILFVDDRCFADSICNSTLLGSSKIENPFREC